MSNKRRYDAEASRAAILEAAERLFIERGFSAVSTAEIARAGGVTKSLIHHYFGTKEALWAAVKEHRLQAYREAQQRLLREREGNAELLLDSVRAFFRFQQANPSFARFVLWTCVEGGGGDEPLVRLGLAKIREAQAAGAIRGDVDAEHVVMAFLGLVQFWFQSRPFHEEWIGRAADEGRDEAFLDGLLKMVAAGLAPAP